MRRALHAMAMLVAAGCGGGGDDAEAFLGTWQAMGTITSRCGMMAPKTDPIPAAGQMAMITITKGASAPLTIVEDACTLSADVNGKTATLRANQSCQQMRSGATVTTIVTSGDFVIDGLKATFSQKGNYTVMLGALAGSCTYDASGTANKQGQ